MISKVSYVRIYLLTFEWRLLRPCYCYLEMPEIVMEGDRRNSRDRIGRKAFDFLDEYIIRVEREEIYPV